MTEVRVASPVLAGLLAGSILAAGPGGAGVAAAQAATSAATSGDESRTVASRPLPTQPTWHAASDTSDPLWTSPPPVQRPTAGVAEVDVPSSGLVRAGELPVLIGAATSGTRPERVTVVVHDQATAAAAGAAFVLVSVRRADGGREPARVRLAIDYSGFRNAYGADFVQRLLMFAVPSCAVQTPPGPGCLESVTLAGHNDTGSAQMIGDVDVPPAPVPSAPSSTTPSPLPAPTLSPLPGNAITPEPGARSLTEASESPTPSIDPTAVVVDPPTLPSPLDQGLRPVFSAVDDLVTWLITSESSSGAGSGTVGLGSGASGPTGDYAATPLSSAAKWGVSKNTGGFSWSYPIPMPPSPAGSTPSLGITYSSQEVDGRTARQNGQVSQVGEGFSFSPMFIERKFQPCTDDGQSTQDLCEKSPEYFLSWNGHASELIRKPSTNEWRLRDDPGWKIRSLTGANNGDQFQGDYWDVTTPDGTRHLFGYGREPVTNAVTNGAWNVPVFGDDPGEPCYSSSGFASSWCMRPWRWNLDRIIDINENVVSLFWNKETNYYARGGVATQATSYDRGGYLRRIDYGERFTRENWAAPAYVTVSTTHRCSTQVNCTDDTLNDPAKYPDVPLDLRCTSSASCPAPGHKAPSFWSTEKIVKVSTWIKNNATTDPALATYSDVDDIELFYSFPPTNESGVSPSLFLRAIRRHGLESTARITLPDVWIGGTALANRVDSDPANGKPVTNKYRVTSIEDELGANTVITYGQENPCSAASLPPSGGWQGNGTDCFPQWFDPDGPGTAPLQQGTFRKYLVTSVDVDDTTVPLPQSPNQLYTYTYLGSPAWHYDDELHTPTSKQSWSDWRGYETVREVRGDTAGGSRSTTLFKAFRGMHGDKASPTGGTKAVTVVDSDGTVFNDDNWLAGRPLETIRRSAAGSDLERTLRRYWSFRQYTGPTAFQPHDVYYVRESRNSAYQRNTIPEPDEWRAHRIDTTYDSTYGVPTSIADLGDSTDPTDDTCAEPTYAHNTTAWIIGLPYVTRRLAGSCASTTQIGRVEVNYDGQAYATAPVRGKPTTVKRLYDGAHAAITGTEYDVLGRVTAVIPPVEYPKPAAEQVKTTTTYVPVAGYPVDGVVTRQGVVNGSDGMLKTTTKFWDAWGVPRQVTDNSNGTTTTIDRDALGRIVSVQRPEDPVGVPGLLYEYAVNQDAPSRVRSRALLTGTTPGDAVYVDSYTYPTSFGQIAETQTVSPTGGRIVTATRYDDQGRVVARTAPMHNGAAAGSGLLNAAPAAVPLEQRTGYDAMSRVTSTGTYAFGVAESVTSASYGGWSYTTNYPVRGDVMTEVDVLGRTTQIVEDDPDSVIGALRTYYTYTLTGLLDTIEDGSLATSDWDYDYDWIGRRTRSVDPDAGETLTTYDLNGDVTSERDAKGDTLTHVYDSLRRRTDTYSGTVATGTLLAHWTYDDPSVTNSKGRLTAATSYVGGAAGAPYSKAVTAYDTRGRITGSRWTIPAAAGALAGTYSYGFGYDHADNLRTTTLPAAGDLTSAETLTATFSNLGLPQALQTSLGTPYVEATGYRNDGRLTSRTLTGGVVRSYTYDTLNRLATTYTEAPLPGGTSGAIENLTYGYDDENNVTAVTDALAGVGGTPQRECFHYDTLNRLTAAYTTNAGSCPASPTPVSFGTDPYDVAYTYDTIGRIQAAKNGSTWSSYAYGDAAHVHAPTQVGSATYAYDANGAMTSRAGQTLAWNKQRRLETTTGVGASSFVYDADGVRLLRTTGSIRTLYLDGMEVIANGSTVTAKRYYGGAAMRTSAGVVVLLRNRQNSTAVAYDPATDTATYQRYTPFGNRRGSTPLAATDRRFLDQTEDPTGLVATGARYYDPAIASFTAPDPLIAPGQSSTLAAYAYSGNNPVTYSDPSGLYRVKPDEYDTYRGCDAACQGNAVEDEKNEGLAARATEKKRRTIDRVLGQLDAMKERDSNEYWAAAGRYCPMDVRGLACESYYRFGVVQEALHPMGIKQWLFEVGNLILMLTPLLSEAGAMAAAEAAAQAGDDALRAATRTAAEEGTAFRRFPKAAQRSEKPPGFDPESWQWREASRQIPERHWWDSAGGEWRYHGADKWHEPHWDYNPWETWNSPWQHIYPGATP